MEQGKFSKLAIHFSSANLFHEESSFSQEIWTNKARPKIDSLPGGVNFPPEAADWRFSIKKIFRNRVVSIVLPFVSHSLEGINPFPGFIMTRLYRRSFTEQVDCAEKGQAVRGP